MMRETERRAGLTGPRPEDFGLTLKRVRKFENPPIKRMAILFTIVATVLAVKTIGISLWWLLLVWLPSFVFGSWLARSAGNRWRKGQPDWSAYRSYSEEAKRYKSDCAGRQHGVPKRSSASEGGTILFRKSFWHAGARRYLDAEDYGIKAFPIKIKRKDMR
jgi:hypothetical protein